jgi:Bacteriophage Sf6, terminase small subunit-like
MKQLGRKPKLSPELQKEICEHLAHGYTVTTVCEIVGIAERTYYTWCSEKKHFSQATTRAIGESKKFLHDKLRQSDDWRAASFLLERRWPREYGKVVERQLPDEPEPKTVSIAVVLNTGGKTLEELVDFPMIDDKPPSSPAPEPEEEEAT